MTVIGFSTVSFSNCSFGNHKMDISSFPLHMAYNQLSTWMAAAYFTNPPPFSSFLTKADPPKSKERFSRAWVPGCLSVSASLFLMLLMVTNYTEMKAH